MMIPMSFSETLFLFFLALIIFGPKKLPEIARLVGKYMSQFRRASNEFRSQIEQEFALMETREQQTARSLSSPLPGTASRTLNSTSSEASPVEATAVEAKEAANAPTSEGSSAADAGADDANDEPLFAGNTVSSSLTNTVGNNGSPLSSPTSHEAVAPDPVTSSAPQESHV